VTLFDGINLSITALISTVIRQFISTDIMRHRPALIGPLYIYTIMHVANVRSIKRQISGQIELSNVSFETGNSTGSYNIIRLCIPYIDFTVSKKVFITFCNNMQFS